MIKRVKPLLWPDPEPHIGISGGSQLVLRETYKHFKTTKRVEMFYDKKANTVSISPTEKMPATGRPIKRVAYIYTISNVKAKNPVIACESFIVHNGLKAPLLTRTMRYRAKWDGRKKTLVVFMDKRLEETGEYQTAMGRGKIGRRRPNAKT